jgi:hypothetical protein
MKSLPSVLGPPVKNIRRWLHGPEHPAEKQRAGPTRLDLGIDPVPGVGHAPGHRHLGPPPEVPIPHTSGPPPQHHPAWMRTGGRVDRLRRSERHGDEKKD